MDTQQIRNALETKFNEPGVRIVFWNDPGEEFQSDLLSVLPPGVELIRLDEASQLEVKLRVERLQPETRFLLYSPAEEPAYEEDWLLDIRLYSRSFRADRASIIMNDLGLHNQSLHGYITRRRTFFESRERMQRLATMAAADDTEATLDLKMLAVAVRAEQPELFSIVRTLFHAFADHGNAAEHDLGLPPTIWKEAERLGLAEAFWKMIEEAFGYREQSPTLGNLLIRLMVSDYAHRLKKDLPGSLQHLVLPPAGRQNAAVALAGWRDSNRFSTSYDILSDNVAEIIGLEAHLHALDIEEMLEVMTFFALEKGIARCLRDRVEGTAHAIDHESVRMIAARRQAGHWASPPLSHRPDVPRKGFYQVYDALVAAADFFALRNRYHTSFEFDTPERMYRAYESELYRFDTLYRHFCEAADHAQAEGWDLLKSLRDTVEASYLNDYLRPLALRWGTFVDPNGSSGLLNRWTIEGVPNQYRFFDEHILPRLQEAENRKVFVIISDAFRYEAAHELLDELNSKYRFQAEISSQLGVLPSYTALGMAALLPHTTLAYKVTQTKGGKTNVAVMADNQGTASLEQRNALLRNIEGLACKSDVLMQMRKEEGRALTNAKRVVYIYHDTIDATGDKASTEEKTFMGVREAINELAALVSYVINNLNGNHIVITADHGFIFTEKAPGETEKSKHGGKPSGTVLPKKRYLIGLGLPEDDAVWRGSTAVTAAAGGEMEFWIPKGINRFDFIGGARFIHGGAMLQEIVVPVITVRQVKAKEAMSRTRPKQARVQVLGSTHKITTSRYRFELIQTDPVGERIKPVTLKVAIYQGDEPVTDIVAMTFDSTSEQMEERRRSVTLTLRDRPYDKKTLYRLVLRDAGTDIEQQSVDVIIDRAFTDDF